ncbi:MAG: hypothetical protein KDE33_02120 [Bacteroidetes bacterium]|nr:hypothetical protein [Bacteroidota bacterium]
MQAAHATLNQSLQKSVLKYTKGTKEILKMPDRTTENIDKKAIEQKKRLTKMQARLEIGVWPHNQQQNVYAMRGFGVKLKFMFHNVVWSRGQFGAGRA